MRRSISATASSRCARFAPSPPDAVVIDLSRMPSHGREVAHSLRGAKATRHLPIVFVDGEPEKVKRTKLLLPDATYTTWGRIKTALPKAIAQAARRTRSFPITMRVGQADGRPSSASSPASRWRCSASPKGFADTLKPLPAKVTFTAGPTRRSTSFSASRAAERELQAHLLALQGLADRQTLWLVWPKKASGVKSDLDGNIVRETGLAAGWVDYKVCSIDDTWSGLAFKRRK